MRRSRFGFSGRKPEIHANARRGGIVPDAPMAEVGSVEDEGLAIFETHRRIIVFSLFALDPDAVLAPHARERYPHIQMRGVNAIVPVTVKGATALLTEMEAKGRRDLIRIDTTEKWSDDRLYEVHVYWLETLKSVEQYIAARIDLIHYVVILLHVGSQMNVLKLFKPERRSSPCPKIEFSGIVFNNGSLRGHVLQKGGG